MCSFLAHKKPVGFLLHPHYHIQPLFALRPTIPPTSARRSTTMGLPNGGPFFPMAQSSTHSSTQSSAINYKRLFRDVFFDRRSVRSVVLIALSMALVALFPLVTQFYLHVAFHR